MNKYIVDVDWLKENLNDKNLVLLDASLNIGDDHEMIPTSRWFDLKNKFSNTDDPFPNAFPSVEKFETEAQNIGINSSGVIVVYDNKGIYSSARIWWMFRQMGHSKIFVLNGGLPEWKKKGYETTTENNTDFEKGDFTAKAELSTVKNYSFMIENQKNQEYQVVDARSSGRYSGTAPEPRKGLKSGKIPDSKNLPFTEVLKDGKFKSADELGLLFNNLDLDNKPIVFSCGSGLTACVLLMAYQMISDETTSIYDGSWTEWATLQGMTE